MRSATIAIGLAMLLTAGCAGGTRSASPPAESLKAGWSSPPSDKPSPSGPTEPADNPKAVVPDRSAVIAGTTAAAAAAPFLPAAPVRPPAAPVYVAPAPAAPVRVPAPVYVPAPPAPVSNGDAVTVPVQPPCPTGSVDTSITGLRLQPSYFQNTMEPWIRYDVTITGTVTNRTNAAVRLDSFNPLTVQLNRSRVDLRAFFPATLLAGAWETWTATTTWTQYNSYDKPEVTAQALNWTWADGLYANCTGGPRF